MRLTDEFLDTVILGIGYVKIAGGIEGDAPRIAELTRLATRTANDFDGVIVGIENLNPAVAEFANILAPFTIDADIVRIAEFSGTGPGTSMAAEKLSATRIYLDPVIAGICDVQIVMGIEAQPFGPVEIVRTLAALAESELELDATARIIRGCVRGLCRRGFVRCRKRWRRRRRRQHQRLCRACLGSQPLKFLDALHDAVFADEDLFV